MRPQLRDFLDELLMTPSPSGYEFDGQRVWVDYVSDFADTVRTDEYGNAVAIHEGDGPTIALAGHADEIGYIVRRIDDDGFIHIGGIGGADRTVTQGQHVTIHGTDGPVPGVIGQSAIHIRDSDNDDLKELNEQRIDIGAADESEARERVEVGDPITVSSTIRELAGSKIAARGLDNRIGTWTVAAGLERVVERDLDATVYAVSTVQEEVGLQGAKMIGYDLDPDAVITIDVTHAADYPDAPDDQTGDIALGDGPVISRGSTNHPTLVTLCREAAETNEISYQLQATGTRTGTDADAFYTQRSGIPAVSIGVPNRYMHTPVELIDLDDLEATAALLGAVIDDAESYSTFGVDI